ncbi:MAG TPA: GNAT family N-acetyltransferase [Puia sp.]|nr:GNAT family N-acetyltransferase [Puia sp.]
MKASSFHKATDCSPENFERIKKYIAEFELDDRNLKQEEFVTVSIGVELIGFGRVREHPAFSEACSLGVIKPERLKGIGKHLMQAMIEKAMKELYLVCVIPSYFKPMGFVICKNFPPEMQEKLEYCTAHLSVDEEYVVMIRQ